MRELAIINPRPRKSSKRKAVTVSVRANPRRKARRSRAVYRRNPRLLGNVGGIVKPLIPAAIGGAGALAADFLLAKLPLPEDIRAKIADGPMRAIARVALALALGYGARFVTSKQNADLIGAGALTVVAYDQIKSFAQKSFPELGLSAYQYMSGYNALPVLRRVNGESGVSAYVPARGRELGMIPVVR